jgi:hypothetical protein
VTENDGSRPPRRPTILRDRFGPEAPLVYLDPDEPIEALLHSGSAADPAAAQRLEAQLGMLLEDAGQTEQSLMAAFAPLAPLPAGSTWLGWVRYVRSLVPRIAGGGVEFPRLGPQPSGVPVPVPSASFTDLSVANEAATQVLRRHETRCRQWAADPKGQPRLHLYADLGRPLGTVTDLTHVTDLADSADPADRADRADRADLADPADLADLADRADLADPQRGSRRPVTGCVVLMRRDPASGKPFIATAHPERSLPQRVRERRPDLAFLFGGYFGQDLHSLDGTTWRAERAVNEAMPAAVRERVVGQLTAMLDDDDDELLRAEVEALGSYVRPLQLRRWVIGLRRRMIELNWTGDDVS